MVTMNVLRRGGCLYGAEAISDQQYRKLNCVISLGSNVVLIVRLLLPDPLRGRRCTDSDKVGFKQQHNKVLVILKRSLVVLISFNDKQLSSNP